MFLRIKKEKQEGLNIVPRILIVTRLLLDAVRTTRGQHLQKVFGTGNSTHSSSTLLKGEGVCQEMDFSNRSLALHGDSRRGNTESPDNIKLLLTEILKCLLWFPDLVEFHINKSFPEDVANEITGELQVKPDLIIGNFTDGNIVASLLAHKLGVTRVFHHSTPLVFLRVWDFCFRVFYCSCSGESQASKLRYLLEVV